MAESIHEKLKRVRKPRVHITYEVETEGAEILKELPFVVGIMGDFSGDPTQPLRPLNERKFIQIDRDNFNEVMARMTPGLNIRVDNKLADDGSEMAVGLKFNSMDDFEPARVAEQVPALEGPPRDPQQAARPDEQGRPLRAARGPARADPDKRERAEIPVGSSSASTRRRAEPCPRPGSLTKAQRHDEPRLRRLLEQVVAATKQTEPDRAQELVKTLVEQALTGTVTFDRNLPRRSTARSPRSTRSSRPSSTRSCITRASCSSKAPGAG